MATTFAVSTGDHLRPFRNYRLKEYPVSISQTVLAGSVMKLAGAGLENRVILSTDSTTTGIVGVAMEAITTTGTFNAATDKVLIALATEEAEFIARTVASTAVDFTAIGTRVSLEIDATYSITRADTADTTNDTIWIMDFLDPANFNTQAAEGDTSAWAVFKFIPGATIWGAGTILA